jgi:hypothetical protein
MSDAFLDSAACFSTSPSKSSSKPLPFAGLAATDKPQAGGADLAAAIEEAGAAGDLEVVPPCPTPWGLEVWGLQQWLRTLRATGGSGHLASVLALLALRLAYWVLLNPRK